MATVTVMIGSNAPGRREKVTEAVALVTGAMNGAVVSDLIDNPDFTGEGPDYLNVVIKGESSLSREELSRRFASIERALGRENYRRPVVGIDVDIVTYGEIIVKPTEYDSEIYKKALAEVESRLISGS